MAPFSDFFGYERRLKNKGKPLSEELDDATLKKIFILDETITMFYSRCPHCQIAVSCTCYDILKREYPSCQICQLLKIPKTFGEFD